MSVCVGLRTNQCPQRPVTPVVPLEAHDVSGLMPTVSEAIAEWKRECVEMPHGWAYV